MTLTQDQQSSPAPALSYGNLSEARKRLIAALDYPDAHTALAAVDGLDNLIQWFKIGLELYISAGNSIVETLKRRGFSVFLDLKLHDIPNTVAGAVRSAAVSGADLLTIHASGGPAMLTAAAEAAATTPSLKLLAVTVLTSMDQSQLAATGITASPGDQVLRLAEVAYNSGIRGFVSSAEELASLRPRYADATLVIPGIRPTGSSIGDQKRVATPAIAIAAGAHHLVIGRPITQSENPAESAKAILTEIAAALQK